MTTMDIRRRTKAAWPSICNASAEDKNRILSAMADSRITRGASSRRSTTPTA